MKLYLEKRVYFYSNRKLLSGTITELYSRPRERDCDLQDYTIEAEVKHKDKSIEGTYQLKLSDLRTNKGRLFNDRH